MGGVEDTPDQSKNISTGVQNSGLTKDFRTDLAEKRQWTDLAE